MRRMWGRRWCGEAVTESEGEQEEEGGISYAEWVSFVTHQVEEEVEKMGTAQRWEELIVERKFGWAGHVLRRGQGRRSRRILCKASFGTRLARGHPTQTWESSFMHLVGVGWQDVAADRSWWHDISRNVAEHTRRRIG